MPTVLTIISSRKNHAWVSMEEIIVWIEDSWMHWAQVRNIPCQLIMAEDAALSEVAKHALSSRFIVVTCFNTSVAGVLRGIREKLGIQVPWVYYLHGLASFGLWPLYQWEIGKLLTTHDIFIGSCQRDKEQFNLALKNVECLIIPFSLNIKRPIPGRKSSGKIKLAYIGRITSQKNLHTLIVALTEVTQPFEMHFFGKPDDYGSPLVGLREKDYLEYLLRLVESLDLTAKVTFHGFMKREVIETMMDNEQWTFIAPSIHSDENFGMAAFRCLLNGHKAILSDWGGHADYPANFPGLVKLITVKDSSIGPYISVNDIVEAIETFPLKESTIQPENMPAVYTEEFIQRRYDDISESMKKRLNSGEKAKTQELLQQILHRRNQFIEASEKPEGIQIYADYRDELLKVFYRAYGMKDSTPSDSQTAGKIVPWVSRLEDNCWVVEDPHRGKFTLPADEDLKKLGLTFG